MFCMNTTSCSCGCNEGCGNSCGFNPCAVTCGGCVRNFGDYAYIYNTTAQSIGEDALVIFSSNGPLSGSITHTAGTGNIVIGKTGVYLITFYVDSATADGQLALLKNSEPVAGGVYPVPYGQVIVSAQMGDVITLENVGAAEITPAVETGVVNASVTIVRLF